MDNKAVILYIEDNQANQILVKRALEPTGHHLITADNGERGIACANEFNPHLILMDINLPTLDGTEITSLLRTNPKFKRTPIVALTADNTDQTRRRVLAVGCDGFIGKPIDIRSFPTTINKYLDGHKEHLNETDKTEALQAFTSDLVARLEKKVQELEYANRNLAEAADQLRELDRLKGDFIKLVSHELRTPLTLVNGYKFLLTEKAKEAEKSGDPTLTNIVNGLNHGISRLSNVVGEIINVSRVTGEYIDLIFGPVKLNHIIRDILKDFQSVLSDRNLTIIEGDTTGLPLFQGDGEKLKIVFRNIIGNAIKFTPDNESIEIIYRVIDESIIITIIDKGIGIPLKEQQKIFEKFYTLNPIENHSTSKTNFLGGGLGLGLPVAKGIIEAHGGRIWVESSQGGPDSGSGSTFHVILSTEALPNKQ